MLNRGKVTKGLEDIVDFFDVMSVIENRCNELKQEAEDAIAMLEDDETQLQYRDDHIAMYQAEIKRLEALLKEQKHSETYVVIDNKTGKEADTYDIALHEDWAKQLCYCDIEGWAIEDDGTLLLVDECGRFAYADRERFKVKWD